MRLSLLTFLSCWTTFRNKVFVRLDVAIEVRNNLAQVTCRLVLYVNQPSDSIFLGALTKRDRTMRQLVAKFFDKTQGPKIVFEPTLDIAFNRLAHL
jgi:hypothetical protein